MMAGFLWFAGFLQTHEPKRMSVFVCIIAILWGSVTVPLRWRLQRDSKYIYPQLGKGYLLCCCCSHLTHIFKCSKREFGFVVLPVNCQTNQRTFFSASSCSILCPFLWFLKVSLIKFPSQSKGCLWQLTLSFSFLFAAFFFQLFSFATVPVVGLWSLCNNTKRLITY